MADIPGNSSTTTSLTVGSSLSSTLDPAGDHDWVKLTLTAGQQVSITLEGASLEDPYLRLYNAAGTMVGENDDITPGGVRDSFLAFTAAAAGTYYIDVGSFDEALGGTYTLSVQNYTARPIATTSLMATQLTDGYWGGDRHQFAAGNGDTLTVNLTALTDEGRNYARIALGLWSDVTGIQFSEVTTVAANITFDDNEAGASGGGTWSNGVIDTASVNVSTQWLTDYRGNGINNYAMLTYIHEVGHALGLGHAGDYNGDAVYATDAVFENDGWPLTVMSYFSQTDSTYYVNKGFSETYALTPMLADVAAMQSLYGLSTTTRTGNTTYGFNSNAGRDVFNAALYSDCAYTVFDSGGTDTLDYSGFGLAQKIDLRQGAYSNVGGYTGNVCIAGGTIIENAIGGSWIDTMYGNAAINQLSGNNGNDRLYGLNGNDTLRGGNGNDVLDGGAQNDSLLGEAGNDVLKGVGGSDRLFGADGDDTIVGGANNDFLDGGAGKDTMLGGTGTDTFVFRDGDFAGKSASTADRIGDFSNTDGDRINLSQVDANTALAGDQSFLFIGNIGFHGVAGELRYQQTGPHTYLMGDTNGDRIADFWIRVDGLHNFAAGDFFL